MIPVNDVYEILIVAELFRLEFSRSILHTYPDEGVSTESNSCRNLHGSGSDFVDVGVVIRFN